MRFVEGPADHGVGGFEPALGESQQRQAGLGIAAELAGALIGGVGSIEVTDQAEEVALDGVGGGEGGGVDRRGEAIASAFGLDEGVGPRSEQLEDLGAMKEAVTTVEHELLLGVAPARHRFRPRSAPTEVEQLHAGVDHAAVGVAGGHG